MVATDRSILPKRPKVVTRVEAIGQSTILDAWNSLCSRRRLEATRLNYKLYKNRRGTRVESMPTNGQRLQTIPIVRILISSLFYGERINLAEKRSSSVHAEERSFPRRAKNLNVLHFRTV